MASLLKSLEAVERQLAKPALLQDTQQVCIDLPGEDIRCYIYKPKLQIMLRKHRDVIFDIALFNGMTYTVEADQSDFYNARDKKIVLLKKQQKVSFADGERLHLHVGRGFKGHLILKANGKALGRYAPKELDAQRYDDEPTTKPAPLIVVMKNEPAPTPDLGVDTANRSGADPTALWASPYKPLEFGTARQTATQDQSMHVVEVKPGSNVPQQIADFFKNGGEQTAIDANGLMTRNWLWTEITGTAALLNDNRQWIKELWKEKFYLQRVAHKSGLKWYVVFKGNTGLRDYLTAARYGTQHAKVISITAGAGTAAGLRHASWGAAKASVKKAGLLTLIFTIVLDTAEWLADYEQRNPATGKPKRDVFDLLFQIGIDVAKAGLSAAMGSLLMGVVVVLATLFAPTVVLPAALIIVGTIGFAIGTGLLIDYMDKMTGTTKKLNKAVRGSAGFLENKLSKDYSGYDRSVQIALEAGFGA